MLKPMILGEAEIVHKLPPSITREIGRVIVAYAKLQHKLTIATGLLLQLQKPEARLVLKQSRVDEQLEVIEDLFALKGIHPDSDFLEARKVFFGAAECKATLVKIEAALDRIECLGKEIDRALLTWPERFRPPAPVIDPLAGRKPKAPRARHSPSRR